MAASIDINGKKLLPIKEVILQVDYSRDYITRLAREKKIVATQIGRMWYVDLDSLKNYQNVTQAEQDIKKRQLSDKRKRDLAFQEAKAAKQAAVRNRVKSKTRAVVALASFVAIGVGVGVMLESYVATNFALFPQVANVKTVVLEEATEQPINLADFAAAARNEVVPEFAPHVTHRDLNSPEGLLLLPLTASSATNTAVTEYFSDPVTLVEEADGSTAVLRLDADGNPVGGEVPFVIVPINTDKP
jgi:hypothetical protein